MKSEGTVCISKDIFTDVEVVGFFLNTLHWIYSSYENQIEVLRAVQPEEPWFSTNVVLAMLNLTDHGFGIPKLWNTCLSFCLALYIGMAANKWNEPCHDFPLYFLRGNK